MGIDEEISGARHTLVLARSLYVQNLVGAKDLGIGVGQQGEFDLTAIREVFQNGFAVIANRRELNSLLLESGFCVLQLYQLPFAIGSPVRGTKKEENRSL